MIEGKNSYDAIKIPKELAQVLDSARLQVKRQHRAALAGRLGGVAAACICMFVLSNNSTVYAMTSGVPVLGNVVQFFHIGEGGTITDGVKGQLAVSDGTLLVEFELDNQERVPHYEVEYHTMPRRVTVAIDGVREFDRSGLQETASQCAGIKDLYFQTVLDDSRVKFTVELEDGIGWQLGEYENPGLLKLSFGSEYDKGEAAPESAWTVRIPSMENGEPLAMVPDSYGSYAMDHEDIKVSPKELLAVKTKTGLFTITAGTYNSEAEAKAIADYLNQLKTTDQTWYPEQLSPTENPN